MGPKLESVPRTLTGMWGEFAVVLHLREAGYEVDWDGGMTANHDLRAVAPGGAAMHFQIKTTTEDNGKIAAPKAGEIVKAWARDLRDTGVVPVYVFVHFVGHASCTLDDGTKTLTVTMPDEYVITACAPEELADLQAVRRTAYGQKRRQRDDRWGKAGDFLPETGLRYPVHSTDFEPLEDVLSALGSK